MCCVKIICPWNVHRWDRNCTVSKTLVLSSSSFFSITTHLPVAICCTQTTCQIGFVWRALSKLQISASVIHWYSGTSHNLSPLTYYRNIHALRHVLYYLCFTIEINVFHGMFTISRTGGTHVPLALWPTGLALSVCNESFCFFLYKEVFINPICIQ